MEGWPVGRPRGGTTRRLTWRDGATTVLAGVTLVAVLAVTREWGWPLLGSARASANSEGPGLQAWN